MGYSIYYSTMGIRTIELRGTPGNLLDFAYLQNVYSAKFRGMNFSFDFGLNKKKRRAVAETLAKAVDTRFVLST